MFLLYVTFLLCYVVKNIIPLPLPGKSTTSSGESSTLVTVLPSSALMSFIEGRGEVYNYDEKNNQI